MSAPRASDKASRQPPGSRGTLIVALGALTHTCGPPLGILALILARIELKKVDAGELPESCRKQARTGQWLAWAGIGVWLLFGVLLAILIPLWPGLLRSLRSLTS